MIDVIFGAGSCAPLFYCEIIDAISPISSALLFFAISDIIPMPMVLISQIGILSIKNY